MKLRLWIMTVVIAALMGTQVWASDITLTLWVHPDFSPSAGLPTVAKLYRQAYAKFEAENPGIKVKYQVERGGTEALQQFLTAATSNTLPDLALLDGFWLARLSQTGKLQPLNDLWSTESRSHWLPQSIDAVTVDGKIYAVPFHTSWRGLFYPVSTMKQLGYDTPPKTWDDFIAFGEKAKAAGMSATMLPAVGHSGTTFLHMLSMFWGLGGTLVDDSGKPVFFEGKSKVALEKVFSLYQELVEKGLMPKAVETLDEKGIRPYLYSGETATAAASSSGVTAFYTDDPALKGNLGAFNYPLPDGATAVPVFTGFTYGIFTSNPERRKAAWKFIMFMNQPDIAGPINAAAGELPVVNEIWEQPFFKDTPLEQQFKAIVESGLMRPRPSVPIYPDIANALSSQLDGVISGTISPAQAVDRARDTVMAEYKRLMNR